MKVYVVSGHLAYEPSDVLGVALNEEDAQKVIDAHMAETKGRKTVGGVMSCWHDSHDWEDFETYTDAPTTSRDIIAKAAHEAGWDKATQGNPLLDLFTKASRHVLVYYNASGGIVAASRGAKGRAGFTITGGRERVMDFLYANRWTKEV